jgi:TRAP-type C4-dicarboxylate transport system permease large subunit
LKRTVTKKSLVDAFQETMRISIMVLLLVAGANMLSYFLALSTIPMKVVEWITDLHVSRYWIIAIILMIYIFLGCFLDSISMMVLTLPVVFPVITGIGFDPIWFGVISVLMMEAGLITPPMGLNVFTVAGVAKGVPMETIFRGAIPFLMAIFAVVFLITVFPQIALMLPRMMR